MIAIIDYGMGNLRSVQKAIEKVGGKTVVTNNPAAIQHASKVILPGVGAMAPAMSRLEELNLIPVIHDTFAAGKPFLGICLGFQLLFDESAEGGKVKTLGIIPGAVKRFEALKVPHIGWNQLEDMRAGCPLFAGIDAKSYFYFCHSYYAEPDRPADVAARTQYGKSFASAVWKDNIYGVQFHPEKSQTNGLAVLKNFTEMSS